MLETSNLHVSAEMLCCVTKFDWDAAFVKFNIIQNCGLIHNCVFHSLESRRQRLIYNLFYCEEGKNTFSRKG